ncbi:hypothetical protein CYMTET_55551 [Cymbomonas tetramitiformis]|uniref:Uncharacterized protein n=1 Tax=Cymbomonas tetramitiformis TaxID=36881 RepID=A0AAE0BDY9_9CHLO|nr:hypothetical protein CYMTET_55551 [Cymbomonas tetramitiformis]
MRSKSIVCWCHDSRSAHLNHLRAGVNSRSAHSLLTDVPSLDLDAQEDPQRSPHVSHQLGGPRGEVAEHRHRLAVTSNGKFPISSEMDKGCTPQLGERTGTGARTDLEVVGSRAQWNRHRAEPKAAHVDVAQHRVHLAGNNQRQGEHLATTHNDAPAPLGVHSTQHKGSTQVKAPSLSAHDAAVGAVAQRNVHLALTRHNRRSAAAQQNPEQLVAPTEQLTVVQTTTSLVLVEHVAVVQCSPQLVAVLHILHNT